MLIAQQLDFDMARVGDELFDEHPVIAEAVQALALGRFKAFAHVGLAEGQPHALAAAACAGLHHHRIADLARDPHRVLSIGNLADKAGDDIDARLHGQLLGLDLVAHGGDGAHRRADKGDVLLRQRLGKTGPFGQEAIAGMYRLRAGLLARGDDLVGDKVALAGRRGADMHGLVSQLHKGAARIGIRIDRHRGNTHAARSADDPAGNFAAIGDEDFCEHYTEPLGLAARAIRMPATIPNNREIIPKRQ